MSNFKLFDFLSDPFFNSVRFDMGAALIPSFGKRTGTYLDEDAIRRLGKEGIDVDSFSDIKVESDTTLSYKGRRVIVYIRDVATYKDEVSLPRYHFSYCRTLDRMQRSNRWARYVAATRDDGLFQVNFTGNDLRTSVEKLVVCQNCLDQLGWEQFSFSRSALAERMRIIKEFSLARFFERYPKDLLSVVPTYDADLAPLNTYAEDWGLISEGIKVERGFKCERCGLVLSGKDRRYLHVHHIDGQKNGVDPQKLRVLCLGCHASEPMHSHMKATTQYKEFMTTFGEDE